LCDHGVAVRAKTQRKRSRKSTRHKRSRPAGRHIAAEVLKGQGACGGGKANGSLVMWISGERLTMQEDAGPAWCVGGPDSAVLQRSIAGLKAQSGKSNLDVGNCRKKGREGAHTQRETN